MPKEKNKTGRALLTARPALPQAPHHICMNVESVFEQDIGIISVFKSRYLRFRIASSFTACRRPMGGFYSVVDSGERPRGSLQSYHQAWHQRLLNVQN